MTKTKILKNQLSKKISKTSHLHYCSKFEGGTAINPRWAKSSSKKIKLRNCQNIVSFTPLDTNLDNPKIPTPVEVHVRVMNEKKANTECSTIEPDADYDTISKNIYKEASTVIVLDSSNHEIRRNSWWNFVVHQ